MTIPQSNMLTGGTCALLKAHAGIVLEKVVREAVHLLGGMGLTKGGTGERIERIWREVKGKFNSHLRPSNGCDSLLTISLFFVFVPACGINSSHCARRQ